MYILNPKPYQTLPDVHWSVHIALMRSSRWNVHKDVSMAPQVCSAAAYGGTQPSRMLKRSTLKP